jgi:hypothetical protein
MIEEEHLVPEDDAVIGKAFRWSLLFFAVAGAILGLFLLLLRRAPEVEPPKESTYVPPRAAERVADPPAVRFVDVTASAGIAFERFNGAAGEKLLPETMGGGAAFLDADLDGAVDLLLVNGTSWPEQPDGPRPTQAFYRGDGAGRFQDATQAFGLDFSLQGMGAAQGDLEGDGDPDVFLSAVGGNRLLLNEGGRFADATASAGVGGDGSAWSTAAAFFDADNDGDLDLYVGNYVRWSREIDLAVDYRLLGTDRAYGPPMNFEGTQPFFYRARGDGVFEEVAAELGLYVVNPATGAPAGKALGAVPIDYDVDGWTDLAVANDTVAKFLFHNEQGSFRECATEVGFAFDSDGRATGAMGIDAADYRNDGSLGIAVGNFANEMTGLYCAEAGQRVFSDDAIVEGIGPASRLVLKFGVLFFDYDLDGRQDFLQANGHLEDQIHKVQASQSYRQPAQLFWNAGAAGRATFVPVASETLGDLVRPLVGRAATVADIDGDGDQDVLLTQAHGAPLLLRNDQDQGHHWLRVRLLGQRANRANRDGIGAWVEVESAGVVQRRAISSARSYLAQVEPVAVFGLGDAPRAEHVRVRWPGGGTSELADVAAGQTVVIEESP